MSADAYTPQTHGWAVYTNVHEEIILVHIPPRNQFGNMQYPVAAAQAGEVHAVRPLNKFPQGLAATGDRVYMVFPQTYANEQRVRRVYSGRALALPMGRGWGFSPIGRLDSKPSIQTPGELIAFTATTKSIWAMLKQDDDRSVLLELVDSAWVEFSLPNEAESETVHWQLSSVGDQLVAMDVSDPKSVAPFILDSDGNWSSLDWPALSVNDSNYELISGPQGLVVIDRIDDRTVSVRSWSKDGVFVLASDVKLPKGTVLTTLGSVNRLLGISKLSLEASQKTDDNQPTIEIHEIDLTDGSVLYSGTPFVAASVSAAELQFILGMMILVMFGILVMVILPEKSDAISIPDGFELADPGRRFTASLIDLFLIASLMGRLFGVRVIEIFTLDVVAQGENTWLTIPLIIVCGLVSMSVCEWLTGATPGKFLVGIRVCRGQAGGFERVTLVNSLIRNVAKWLLPPVAALALVDPEMLHRGDRVTRSLVVSAVTPDPSKPDSQED